MRKDQLTSYNGETIAYDAMGNPTVYRGMEMGWKNSSELTEIVKDQTTIRYRYDKEGMRNRKYLSDGTTVLYQVQDGQIIGEQHLREDQEKPLYEMTFSYDADGTLFSMNCDGKDYYYILNPTGDVIALVDTGWNTVVSYAYDSWGNVTAIEGDQDLGKKNPLRYRGYYWDEETGLYYLASRYYDPEVGRFISIDDTSALGIASTRFTNKNLYAYCDNNPMVRKDKGGGFWETAFDVISLGASIVEVSQNPSDPWAWAALVGDTVDLLPFVTGAGEMTRAVHTTVKAVKKGEDVVEVAQSLRKAAKAASPIKKVTGSYEILYKSKKTYIGKGSFKRAIKSAIQHTKEENKIVDSVVSIRWKSAPSVREAFIDEYFMQSKRYKDAIKNNYSYNKIWSPGKKYCIKKYGKLRR